jgi:ketosteroid isomerase-like protein
VSKYIHNDSEFRVLAMVRLFDYDSSLEGYGEAFSKLQGQKLQMNEEHINVVSPTVAIYHGVGSESQTTLDGETIELLMGITTVWSKIDDVWKVVSHHESNIPKPSEETESE